MNDRFVIAMICSAAWLSGDAEGNAPDAASAEPSAVSVTPDRPTLPDVRLAKVGKPASSVPGLDDDAPLVKTISDRVARLTEAPDGEVPALDHATSLLAASNLILAQQVEPACSRKLLRLDGAEDPRASAALDHADRLMAQVETLIAGEEKDGEDASGLVALERNRKKLHAFSAGLRAFLLTGKGDDVSSRRRQAASMLSPVIEDEDPAVSAAATLWRACLRSDDSDIPRVLSVLDLALIEPAKETLPYALFSSIERCRLLAAQGGRTAALALLMQLETRCEVWLDDADQKEQAERLVQFAQMQIVLDWHASSSGGSDGEKPAKDSLEEQKWCAERIERIKAEGFADAGADLLRLGNAIPIIVAAPED